MKTLTMGAILWDIMPSGEYIGGAPFNVSGNLAKLGCQSAIFSCVGEDERGKKALETVEKLNVLKDLVLLDKKLPTGTALVHFDEKTNEPSYEIPLSAFDALRADDELVAQIQAFKPDLLYFGTLDQRDVRSRSAIAAVLESVSAKETLFDVNLRLDFYSKELLEYGFGYATIVKINEDEHVVLSKLLYNEELSREEFAFKLRWDFPNIHTVIITLGSKGCMVANGENVFTVPAKEVQVGDTVGAGDAFSAAYVWAVLSGYDAKTAAKCGSAVGGYVASKTGALPDWDASIYEELKDICKK